MSTIKWGSVPIYPYLPHVQINVGQTSGKMVVGSNGRRMIAVFPKGPFAFFPLVEFLCDSSGDQLHAFGNLVVPSIFDQQVDV